MTPQPRMGRIGFLNVLPVFHAMETGKVPHGFDLVYGPPSQLNNQMSAGELDVSSTSSMEYARHPERYAIVPGISIASDGPVMSVVLISRRPVENLGGQTVLISAQTHTSVELLKLLLAERAGNDVRYVTGNATDALTGTRPPEAALVIGDEALRFRKHPEYPYRMDLGGAWREVTGLPFVFGLWIARKDFTSSAADTNPAAVLHASRDWALANLDTVIDVAEPKCSLDREELRHYYSTALRFVLGEAEQQGLRLFYERLAASGVIGRPPELVFR